MARRYGTIGIDLVAMSVDDIAVQGAEPLFFLDYLATGRLSPEIAEQVVSGVARACRENGCALIGGETAEMPGFYADGEYDLAGFIVGIVERERIIDGRAIAPGDAIIGLRSAGLHTNGYSLARRVLFDVSGLHAESFLAELGMTVGQALLAPHRSYLPAIRPLLAEGVMKGMAHITGGGITENLPRVLPAGCAASIDTRAWTVPAIFSLLRERGRIAGDEMFRAFNMGIGLIVVCAGSAAGRVVGQLEAAGESGAVVIGHVEPGERVVRVAADDQRDAVFFSGLPFRLSDDSNDKARATSHFQRAQPSGAPRMIASRIDSISLSVWGRLTISSQSDGG
jgi:phosphoribosylaminoimidazole synthetase